jgi:hypothetical protein
MRRIVHAGLLLAALTSCDPTGEIPAGSPTADIRVVNLVVDVPSIDVVASGGSHILGTAFGEVSAVAAIGSSNTSFETRVTGSGAVLGTTNVDLVTGQAFTFYALGKAAGFDAVFAADDIGSATDSTYRIRFVHGLGLRIGEGLDVYLTDPAASLSGLTPTLTNARFAAASAYISADTSLRRIRVTPTGLPTVVFDTTFATHLADSTSFTFVLTDAAGGGEPATMHLVTDKGP